MVVITCLSKYLCKFVVLRQCIKISTAAFQSHSSDSWQSWKYCSESVVLDGCEVENPRKLS